MLWNQVINKYIVAEVFLADGYAVLSQIIHKIQWGERYWIDTKAMKQTSLRMRRALRYWECAVVAAVILYGSLIREPHFQLPPVEGADKWVHILMYLGLGATLMWDMLRDRQQGWKLWLIALVVPMVYGGVIEILQENFFYPRTGDWLDWLADIVGTIAGCVAAYSVNHWWRGRRVAK